MSKWMQKIDFNSSEQKYEDGEISFQEMTFNLQTVGRIEMVTLSA